jgi:hypothetical protein
VLLLGGTICLMSGCVTHAEVGAGGYAGPYYDYEYYPAQDVYYYPQGRVYYWHEGDAWRSGRRLPTHYDVREAHHEHYRGHSREPWTELHHEHGEHEEHEEHEHH